MREGGEIKIWVYKRNPEPEKEVWGEALVLHFTAHALSRDGSAPATGLLTQGLVSKSQDGDGRAEEVETGGQRRWEMGPPGSTRKAHDGCRSASQAQGNLANSVSCFRNQSRIPDGDLRRVGGGD